MKKVAVIIKSLTKEFSSLLRGKVCALKDISIHIKGGEFFILLGPSGSGKSTFLSLVAGIEIPTKGEIIFGDEKVVSVEERIFLSPKERRVAMVFQSYALYPHLTVYDNIAFPLTMEKVPKCEIDKKVNQIAEMLEITDLLTSKPRELSGGQRQRVAIARAIVRNPTIFLLDEPLSNLDAQLRGRMRVEIKKLQRRLGVTTIYVTHDQLEALTLGDRIGIIKDGIIQQVDSPLNVYHRPANIFVASFLGSPPMNLLRGVIKRIGEKTFVNIEGWQIELTGLNRIDGEEVTVGIRAEDIILNPPVGGISVAVLEDKELLGDVYLLHFRIGKTKLIVKSFQGEKFREKDKFSLELSPSKLCLFNRKGVRIGLER